MSIPSGAPGSSSIVLPFSISRKFAALPALGLLLFALGCGSNGSSATGPYSTSSLKGSYVVRLSGNDSFLDINNNLQTETYTETLVMTADGSGNLTGVEDFNSSLPASGFTPGTAFTGIYQLGKDGNGSMQINFTSPASGQINLSFTLVSTSKFYVAEADAFSNFSANAAGVGMKQDATAVTNTPAGTFVTRVHQTPPISFSSATVGALTVNNTTVTGTIDVLRNDTFLPQLTLSAGNVTAPDANGRGTLVYTDSASVSTTYQYYVVDANTFWLMGSGSTKLGTGNAEKQANGGLTLSGNYAFGSSGDTDTTLGAARSVGVFTANAGTISAGALDSVQDGASLLDQPFTGTFTQNGGRVDATITPTGGSPVQEIFWMVSPSRAFFLVASTNKVEDGTIDMQQQNTFSATDLNPQFAYALVMDGFNTTSLLTRIGTLYADGKGNFNLNEEANSFVPGSLPGLINDPGTLPGNYQVRSDGRVTGAINTLSSNLILYMVGPGQAYILQNDPGVEISGQITSQTSP
ncbi:MAG TPA: hypothetical protein VLL05_16290 [Terriglobales bacterium]|nr:hypothetical protein [Terriglobales bacterium]